MDTGLRDMPRDRHRAVPADWRAADVDDVLISHADVDHCGGNRAAARARRRARASLCGEADRAVDRVQRGDAGRQLPLVRGLRLRARRRRTWRSWSASWAATRPIDVGLRGGETLRLGPRPAARGARAARPHAGTPRAVGPARPARRSSSTRCSADGVYDRAGHRLIPPRYYDAADYEATIRRLRALDPGAAADRALRRDGARRRARVPRSLAGLRAAPCAARSTRARARARPSCGALTAGGGRGGRPVPGVHARARGVGARAPRGGPEPTDSRASVPLCSDSPGGSPPAVLLAAQLARRAAVPVHGRQRRGRALFSLFGIAILGLVLLAVRSSPAWTWFGVLLALPASVLLADPGGHRQRRPAPLLLGHRGGPLLLRRRRAHRVHARRPRDHPRRAVRRGRHLHARRLGVRLLVHRPAGHRAPELHRGDRPRRATAAGSSCSS